MEKKEQKIPRIDLLTPLTGEFFPDAAKHGYDEEMEEGYGIPLDGESLAPYEEAIRAMADQENRAGQGQEAPCNLMDYFHGSDAIKEKVSSAVVSVKNVEGVLYGCTTLTLGEFLEAAELQELCEYMTGQYSDGWGEGFEQRDIAVDGGTLHVHFYQPGDFQMQKQETVNIQKDAAGKKRPKLKLLGRNGNIFSIAGEAGKLLVQNGQEKEAKEMYGRVWESHDYYKALRIISEYVQTELSPLRKTDKGRKKPEKGECR